MALVRPSPGPISSPFGTRRLPNEPPTFHGGTDFVGALGSPVRAVTAGTVVVAAPNGTYSRYGNLVVIKHDDPKEAPYSLYAHLNTIRVRKGQKVKAGRLVGTMGNTSADSADPNRTVRTHLHFELLKHWPARRDEGRIDSTAYLQPPKQQYVSPAIYPETGTSPLLYPGLSPRGPLLSQTGFSGDDITSPWAPLVVLIGLGIWFMSRGSG